MMMQAVARNGKEADKQNEYQHSCKNNCKAVHYYSPSLFNIVAMLNVAMNDNNPVAKTRERNSAPGINWLITSAAKTSFPTSYNALANPLRCDLSSVITQLSIEDKLIFVKEKVPQDRLAGLRVGGFNRPIGKPANQFVIASPAKRGEAIFNEEKCVRPYLLCGKVIVE